MNSKVYLMRTVLGVQRVGMNESLKAETLEKFMISRYSVIRYITDYYKMNWLAGEKYRMWHLTMFEQEI